MRRALTVMLLAAAVCMSSFSMAQPDSEHSEVAALFAEGRKLIEEGRYAEACPKLERAFEVLQGAGLQYNLARCYAEVGKLASAYRHFKEVSEISRRAGQMDRSATAAKRAGDLEPRLSRLILDVQSPAAGLVVQIDGKEWPAGDWTRGAPIDRGQHEVVASAPGFEPWHGEAVIDAEGKTVTLTIPPLGDGSSGEVPVTPSPDEPSDGSAQSIVGLIVGGVGIIGMGVGIGLGFAAKSKYGDSDEHCEPDGCDEEGSQIVEDAQALGNVATGVFIGGAVMAAVGLVTFLTAPSSDAEEASAIRVVPQLGPSTWGLSFGGSM